MKNTGALIRDFDRQIHPFAKFSLRNSSSSFCSVGERRLKPNEPIHPEVLSQSTTRTSQTSSQKRPLPTSPTEQKELDEFLRENLANGQIHLLKSPIGAPVFFIKKKEGSLCLVQDYQK